MTRFQFPQFRPLVSSASTEAAFKSSWRKAAAFSPPSEKQMVLLSGIMYMFSPQLRLSGKGIRVGGGPSALMITGAFFSSEQEAVINRTAKRAASFVMRVFISIVFNYGCVVHAEDAKVSQRTRKTSASFASFSASSA